MVRPDRQPLAERVEADETIDGRAVDPVPQGTASRGRGRRVGGAQPGRPGRGAAGKTVVAGAVEAAPGKDRKRRLGRLRLQAVPDASANSLECFLAGNVAPRAAVTTDGWQGYAGLGDAGYAHQPINLTTGWGDAVLWLRPPGLLAHARSAAERNWPPPTPSTPTKSVSQNRQMARPRSSEVDPVFGTGGLIGRWLAPSC